MNNTSIKVQNFIIKMKDKNHRLFEYHIVNLSEKDLKDTVNKVFSNGDKKRMRELWKKVYIFCIYSLHQL